MVRLGLDIELADLKFENIAPDQIYVTSQVS